ncbi:MAG TPA: hypothetical protein VGR00_02745, partial [Thermoanaerobaculia bacterium]|nr:hypothetical protein [Thermoanaerobaculia bacterium]
MPRRFALTLLALLVLLLAALFLGRRLFIARDRRVGPTPAPKAPPTASIPPTPIPGRRVALYFEGTADERLHPEARDVAAAADDVAFLRSLASSVLDGPRRPELLRPFPAGWTLRAAYRMKDGLVVLDLAPPPP